MRSLLPLPRTRSMSSLRSMSPRFKPVSSLTRSPDAYSNSRIARSRSTIRRLSSFADASLRRPEPASRSRHHAVQKRVQILGAQNRGNALWQLGSRHHARRVPHDQSFAHRKFEKRSNRRELAGNRGFFQFQIVQVRHEFPNHQMRDVLREAALRCREGLET